MPEEVPIEAVKKTDATGRFFILSLKIAKYPIPPNGFMRKSNNSRSPDYNVFISNTSGFSSSK